MSTFKTGVPAALGIVVQPDHTASPVSILANFAGVVGTPESRFNSLEFEPMKSADKTANTGNVYIGYVDMNMITGRHQ